MTTMATVPNRQFRLFVHLDPDGQVWAAPRGQLPAATGQDAAAWVRAHAVPDSGAYYLLGAAGNAPLVVALAEAHPGAAIHLHAPAVCPTAALRRDPASVLRRLQQPELSDCRPGRRHRLEPADLAAYRLVAARSAGGRDLRPLLERHPAYPAVAYLAGRSLGLPEVERHAVELLAAIVDPRWYVHPGRPGRRGPLYRHLGVVPANFRGSVAGAPGGPHAPAALAAAALWDNVSTRADLAAYGAGRPEAFLWRIAAAHRPGWKGALRATETALDLLARVWLARAAPGRGAHFDAARFFRTAEEAAAYTNHCKKLAACTAAAG
jgi:hypothetical protein